MFNDVELFRLVHFLTIVISHRYPNFLKKMAITKYFFQFFVYKENYQKYQEVRGTIFTFEKVYASLNFYVWGYVNSKRLGTTELEYISRHEEHIQPQTTKDM